MQIILSLRDRPIAFRLVSVVIAVIYCRVNCPSLLVKAYYTIITSGRRIKPIIHIRYGPASSCFLKLLIYLYRLFIRRFWFVHYLDVERNYFDSNM